MRMDQARLFSQGEAILSLVGGSIQQLRLLLGNLQREPGQPFWQHAATEAAGLPASAIPRRASGVASAPCLPQGGQREQ